MIFKHTVNVNIHNEAGEFNNTQYLGKDVPNKFKKYLNKEYHSDQIDGVIIGIEENEEYIDYYFIIYDPDQEIVRFELINYPAKIEGIKE